MAQLEGPQAKYICMKGLKPHLRSRDYAVAVLQHISSIAQVHRRPIEIDRYSYPPHLFFT
jgi:hypothetical protein